MISAAAFQLLGWLSGSAPGRRVAIALLLVAAFVTVAAILYWRARSQGYETRRAEEMQEALAAAAARLKVDEEVRAMSATGRARELRRWVRDGVHG